MAFIIIMIGVVFLTTKLIYKESSQLLKLGLPSWKIWPVILFTSINFFLAALVFIADHFQGTETVYKQFLFLGYLFGMAWIYAIQYIYLEMANEEDEEN